MNYTEGQQFRLRVSVGDTLVNDDGETVPTNTPELALRAGWVGTVREVVPDGAHGGGPVEGETVVLEFPWEELARDAEGHASIVVVQRAVSFTEEQMAEWFEAV